MSFLRVTRELIHVFMSNWFYCHLRPIPAPRVTNVGLPTVDGQESGSLDIEPKSQWQSR